MYMAESPLTRTLMVCDPNVEQQRLTDTVGLALENKTEVSVRLTAGASALDYDAPFTGKIAVIDELLPPVSPAEAGTVRCIGLNYKEHAVCYLTTVRWHTLILHRPR